MTRQEFKTLVYRNQRWERVSGYLMFLIPLAAAVGFFGNSVIGYFSGEYAPSLIVFALIVALICLAFFWWGVRKINRKFQTFIIFKFDEAQLTSNELIDLITHRLNYRKKGNDSGLITLQANGWQTDHEIYTGSNAGELFADLRLTDNDGIFTWSTKKLKERLIKEIISVGEERNCNIQVDRHAQ